MTSRMLRGLAVGFVAVVMLTGCSETTQGTPHASGAGPATTTKPGSSTATSRPSTTASASDLKPCELLTSADAATLGLGAGKPNSGGRLAICTWTAPGKLSIAITIDNKGLGGLAGEKVELAKHKAIKSLETGGFGGCGVVVEISDKASAIIAAVLSGGAAEAACPRAVDIAKIIDPKLP